jgi:hypothetical protein
MPASADSLSSLERRAWRSNFDDGLFEMLLGSMLLLLWAGTVVSNNRLLYPFFLGLPGVFVLIKYFVVVPRAGAARFSRPRRQRKALGAVVLATSAILGTVVTVLFALDGSAAEWLRAHPIVFEAGFPLMVVAVFSALAALNDMPRIHVMGVVMALAFGVHLWLHQGWGFLVGGALLCIPGLALFTRFLREHPVVNDGGNAP